MIPTHPGWPDLILVLLIALYTAYCAATSRRTREQMISGTLTRGRVYSEIITAQWSAVLLLAAIWWLAARSTTELGLATTGPAAIFSTGWGIAAWAMTLLISSYLLFQIWSVGRSAETRRQIRRQIGELEFMLPRTRRQLWGFSAVGVTAGICEEVLYRGFLLWWCQAALGLSLTAAAVAVTLLFSLGHAYQGPQGMIRTGLMGALLMAVRLAAGSLWPAIVLHIAVDVLGGWSVFRAQRETDLTGSTRASGPPASLRPADTPAAQA